MPIHLARSTPAHRARPTSVRELPPPAASRGSWRTDCVPTLLGDRIVQFRDPAHAAEPIQPFPAFVAEPKPLGPGPGVTPLRPRFRDRPEAREIEIPVSGRVDYYGTGEVAGPLRRNRKRATLWNTDSFAYSERTESVYQAQPFLMGVREDGSAFGVIVRTTWRCRIDADADAIRVRVGGTYRGIRGGIRPESPAVVVIERASPREVVEALASLTGTIPMPPRWALGYHQCRWSYNPESRVREVARDFREKKIPCDVIWFDIDYMDGFRCFTFDKAQFPDPAKLNADLHAMGFSTVWMIDPGLKVDPEYRPCAEGLAAGHFVRDARGNVYTGKVWPGDCHFPDYTNAKVRSWWAGLYKDYMATGIDGVWNDMNEPAVFDVPGKTMPEDNRHHADPELGGPGPHARYHNIYGMQMVRASREGIAAANPDKRTFILTRANFLGGHRYAATWTGDNVSDWTHLRWSISMILNLGLSGQALAGPDIGGFMGDATPQMFARWLGIGALLPFSRAHSVKGSKDHEPWSFGEDAERACRLALTRRYRLMPYLYTLAHAAHKTGLPIARPVFFADPRDQRLRGIDDAFLLGDDLHVECRVTPSGAESPSPLPEGAWRAFEPAEQHHDLPTLRLRPGAIVPMGPAMQHTKEKPLDPLTLVVNPDRDGVASGVLYEDAGEGHAFEKGEYLISRYQAHTHAGGKNLVVRLASSEGSMPRPNRHLRVEVLLPDGRTAVGEGHDGKDITVHL